MFVKQRPKKKKKQRNFRTQCSIQAYIHTFCEKLLKRKSVKLFKRKNVKIRRFMSVKQRRKIKLKTLQHNGM